MKEIAMTLQQSIRIGSTADEAPEVIWEVSIEATFDPRLSADEIDTLQDRVSTRLEEMVRAAMGEDRSAAQIRTATMIPLRGRGATSPLFPMVAGESRFTCNLDVVEVIERLCEGTDLEQIAYDARGRAYALSATVEYYPRPELNGHSRAPMPNPEHVLR